MPYSQVEKQYLSDKKTLHYGCDSNAPPLSFSDGDKNIEGLIIDYMGAISIECGIPLQSVTAPWNNTIENLRKSNVDIVDMFPTKKRGEEFSFTQPIYTLNGAIATIDPQIKDIKDLNGKIIAVIEGDFAQEKLRDILKDKPNRKYKIKTYDSMNDGIMALKNAEVDAVAGDEAVIAYIINKSTDEEHCRILPSKLYSNCQSFSSGLIESELFGHEKGAFTGASGKRIGRFEEAHSGTIFLDEIGDLPLDTQSKLLRTIENRTIERLGSNKRIELDFRIISATNKNIEELISTGDFREDLFYRINTLTLTIPPLRERREDIPGLIDFFVKKIEKEQKKPIKRIDDDVLDKLYNYDYPGNVRELKNLLERLITLSENGIITFDKSDGYLPINFNTHLIKSDGLREARKAFEKEYIEGALKLNKYNISKTANQIKISDRQLWNKISELEIEIVKK